MNLTNANRRTYLEDYTHADQMQPAGYVFDGSDSCAVKIEHQQTFGQIPAGQNLDEINTFLKEQAVTGSYS